MRDVLRGTLGRSLRTLSDEDRLAAAWVVACGPALAERAEVLGLDDDLVLHVRVLQPGWRDQFAQMRNDAGTGELRKIAGVKVQTMTLRRTGFSERVETRGCGARSTGPGGHGDGEASERATEGAAKEFMSGAATVTIDDVRHVADLASLELTPEELPRLAKDLNEVLSYIAQLNELDTRDVPAMAQASEVLGLALAEHGETLRPDEVLPATDRAEVMREAPETDGRFFKVPKVIERW